MPTSNTKTFEKIFKMPQGEVSVTLYDHHNWAPSGLGGITYYTDVSISGPIGNKGARLKYRDGNSSAGDDWSNNFSSVSAVRIEGNSYILTTPKGEKKFS